MGKKHRKDKEGIAVAMPSKSVTRGANGLERAFASRRPQAVTIPREETSGVDGRDFVVRELVPRALGAEATLVEALRRAESRRLDAMDSMIVTSASSLSIEISSALEARLAAISSQLASVGRLLEFPADTVPQYFSGTYELLQREVADLREALVAESRARHEVESALMLTQQALEEHQWQLRRIVASRRWRLLAWWDRVVLRFRTGSDGNHDAAPIP